MNMKSFCVVVAVGMTFALSAAVEFSAFENPAKEHRPETWFHLIGGNVSKAGLVADLEAVKAAGMEQQTEYISFSRHICEELVKRAPKADVAYLNGDLTPEELYNLEIDGLDYYYTTILENAEWVKQAHYWGLTVNIWTVNDEESMRKAIEQKINFITTDEPILLQQILRESK